MVDPTVINNATRKWLDSQRWVSVDLEIPFWDGTRWYVLVKNDSVLLGTVVLDEKGIVKKDVSFPNQS